MLPRYPGLDGAAGEPAGNHGQRDVAALPQACDSARTTAIPNASVKGKFLCAGDQKLYPRGVTYGPFRPDGRGSDFHQPPVVERDFAQMPLHGINAIRIYTVPPRWLLDAALRHDLRVMVGIPWEQHIAFLDSRHRVQSIEDRVRDAVTACTGHPAVLCYAIGNEIPAPIVRWYGRRRVERFLRHLYWVAKEEDPYGLVTYVNYPTTEYLQLPFLDLVCFNVYLESQDRFARYLARLQNVAGDRPLMVTELGLDSRQHGLEAQEEAVSWQLRTAFDAGCAGAFVFSWTDEWHRGGEDIEGWGFGLTQRDRTSKPALDAARQAFAQAPFPIDRPWPRISVIVCCFNEARTISECLDGLQRLDYPDVEVIVVDDGSTDGTAAIAQDYGVRVIRCETNGGLSAARNVGLNAATGSIVAYIDADAYPDPSWLRYLATTFLDTGHVGVGGPNLPPAGDGWLAECIANAPGGPMHVLLSDEEAEHIPGCNMAFRNSCLQEVGGFDPQFRVAGDDVDACWQLRQRGWTLGFSPAAVVWHHRRNSVRTYWKQQAGYGKAEALLARKWPEKYNSAGHLSWAGRMYGSGITRSLAWFRARIYQGPWGSAPFQSIDYPSPGPFESVLLMPEWYLLVSMLLVLGGIGLAWKPLLLSLPAAAIILASLIAQAGLSAARAAFPSARQSRLTRLKFITVTTFLHLLQPLARLVGRFRHGLTPWRWSKRAGLTLPWPRTLTIWSEDWQPSANRLGAIELALQRAGARVLRGGDYDHWDLEVRGGMLGMVRLRMAIEEHGAGQQLVRVRSWPRWSGPGFAAMLLWADREVDSDDARVRASQSGWTIRMRSASSPISSASCCLCAWALLSSAGSAVTGPGRLPDGASSTGLIAVMNRPR